MRRAALRFLRPFGADVLKQLCSHGLRTARLAVGASPVATIRRPFGARKKFLATSTSHGVALRPPCSGWCSTRGYNPPPLRGGRRERHFTRGGSENRTRLIRSHYPLSRPPVFQKSCKGRREQVGHGSLGASRRRVLQFAQTPWIAALTDLLRPSEARKACSESSYKTLRERN